ncbi:MAG: DUF3108 domain-containing protein [Cereibacter sphaeroides]|uniref:DUF3108 domain-containing protein n=1 Tax=Cereibacter sphaeroides TaxID=1063 RepID=A0A2W5SAP3_CERSP|nr:MAG: DUF3108 domain-containing protein [Cereibacter sphaeroides]
MRKPWVGRLAAALVGAAMAAPVMAADAVVFDLSVRGIKAGTLTFTGDAGGGRYEVKGRLESAGLVGMLRKVRYDGQADGALKGEKFTPARYFEKADTGKRQSESVMEYRRGVPQIKVYNPPRAPGEGGLDPATQGGTVDPLTAMYAALRDVPAGQECNKKLVLFDGKRRTQVVLGKPRATDAGVSCAGEYRRLEGFSADDMAEKSRFPFTLYLQPEGGQMRVTEVAMESIYGNAKLIRR